MDNTQSHGTHHGSTDFNKSIPIRLKRTFNAPVEQLWMAWSTSELVKQWWGPENYECPEAKIDFRVGGKYNFAMRGPDGKTMWSGGEYKEIVPNKKIVYTDNFTDQDGNVVPASAYGMPGEWPENLVTVTFDKFGNGECQMVAVHAGIPAEMHDECIDGWNSTIDKLQNLVESH